MRRFTLILPLAFSCASPGILSESALQQAVDRVPEGGELVIPAGTYVLKTSLVLKSNMTLSGKGAVLTVLPDPPCSPLVEDAPQGARSIRVADETRFEAGMHVAVWDKENNGWDTSEAVVVAVRAGVLELDRPLSEAHKTAHRAWAGHLFPAIYARDCSDLSIRSLRIQGPKTPTPFQDFTLSAIHLVRCRATRISRCVVEDWHSDGFSVQGGSDALVLNNVARRNRGHGFHPGTALRDAVWSGNLGEHNGNFGLFYCMKVERVVVSRSTFRRNASHGVGGLGEGDDVDNLVFNNDCEENGEAGIHIGFDRSTQTGGGKGRANFVVGNRCSRNGAAGILMVDATENVVAQNRLDETHGVIERRSERNYFAANTLNGRPYLSEEFPGTIPPERLNLLSELKDLDAQVR